MKRFDDISTDELEDSSVDTTDETLRQASAPAVAARIHFDPAEGTTTAGEVAAGPQPKVIAAAAHHDDDDGSDGGGGGAAILSLQNDDLMATVAQPSVSRQTAVDVGAEKANEDRGVAGSGITVAKHIGEGVDGYDMPKNVRAAKSISPDASSSSRSSSSDGWEVAEACSLSRKKNQTSALAEALVDRKEGGREGGVAKPSVDFEKAPRESSTVAVPPAATASATADEAISPVVFAPVDAAMAGGDEEAVVALQEAIVPRVALLDGVVSSAPAAAAVSVAPTSAQRPVPQRRRQQLMAEAETDIDDICPFAAYAFPRLDATLADYKSPGEDGAGTMVVEPPNCIETAIAYLLTTDCRMSLYFGILFFSLLFTIVSIPTSQMDGLNRSCYTYWGYKENCDKAAYTTPASLYSTCPAMKGRMMAGAAFAMMALIFYSTAFCTTLVVIFCLQQSPHRVTARSRLIIGFLGGGAALLQMIAWIMVANMETVAHCGDTGDLAYGVGFGLSLTSWMLNLAGLAGFFMPQSRLKKWLHTEARD